MNSCVNLLFSSETMPWPTFMVGLFYILSMLQILYQKHISVCDFYRNAIGSAEEVFVFLKVRNNS